MSTSRSQTKAVDNFQDLDHHSSNTTGFSACKRLGSGFLGSKDLSDHVFRCPFVAITI